MTTLESASSPKTTANEIPSIFFFIMLFGCNKPYSNGKKSEAQDKDTIYDILRGELVRETEDSLWFEPYQRRIPKIRIIFKKGKHYTFQVEYKDQDDKRLSTSNLRIISTGERMEFAPHRQDKIIYEFISYQQDSFLLSKHRLNQELQYWTSRSVEGVIENIEEVWMHPPRANQYKFTEVAPFPHIYLPPEIGRGWESNLYIEGGWGEWSGMNGNSEYVIDRKDDFLFEGRSIICWIVKAKSTFPFGVSHAEFWFNEEYGFVKMHYINYLNETLHIELTEVEDIS